MRSSALVSAAALFSLVAADSIGGKSFETADTLGGLEKSSDSSHGRLSKRHPSIDDEHVLTNASRALRTAAAEDSIGEADGELTSGYSHHDDREYRILLYG